MGQWNGRGWEKHSKDTKKSHFLSAVFVCFINIKKLKENFMAHIIVLLVLKPSFSSAAKNAVFSVSTENVQLFTRKEFPTERLGEEMSDMVGAKGYQQGVH